MSTSYGKVEVLVTKIQFRNLRRNIKSQCEPNFLSNSVQSWGSSIIAIFKSIIFNLWEIAIFHKIFKKSHQKLQCNRDFRLNTTETLPTLCKTLFHYIFRNFIEKFVGKICWEIIVVVTNSCLYVSEERYCVTRSSQYNKPKKQTGKTNRKLSGIIFEESQNF